MKKILIHGSGHKGASWNETISYMNDNKDILCPDLSTILNGKEIICGEKDNANIKSAYYLSENIKNAELKMIPNTGHIVNEENPKELSELLTEFWKEQEK